MEFNTQAFGYGVALVMLGWACGFVVNIALSVIRKGSHSI